MAMIFDLDESKNIYDVLTKWYVNGILDEDENYGSPILKHTVWDKPLDTAEQFLYALFDLRSKHKDKAVAFCCSSKNENGSAYALKSVEVQGDSLVFQFTEIPQVQAMPVDFLIHGVREEVKDPNKLKGMKCGFVCDGKAMDIKELCLDIVRFPDDPEIYYIIHAEVQKAAAGKAVNAPVDAYANKPPYTPDDFITQCIGIQIRSKRPALANSPVIFEIPTVPDKYIGDLPEGMPEEMRNAIGQLCVIDTVVEKGNHIEVNLMSFDRSKEYEKIFNDAGEFSSMAVQKKMRKVNPDAALFFMYMGKPYEIETMEAKVGSPIWCVLAPWGTLDESNTPKYKNEIEMWAEWCKDPILSWQV